MIYSAAKAAVNHLTVCVSMELGEHNVRVNSISPGGIATGIFGKALGLPPAKAEATAEAVKIGLTKMQPIPRAGEPLDIANAALFLASDESSFITGHELVVDGGLTIGRRRTEADFRPETRIAQLGMGEIEIIDAFRHVIGKLVGQRKAEPERRAVLGNHVNAGHFRLFPAIKCKRGRNQRLA